MMRKLLVLLFALTCFWACGDKNEDPEPEEISILGQWYPTRIEYYDLADDQLIELETEADLHFEGCPDFWDFKSDNTFDFIEHDFDCSVIFTQNGTYTRNGESLTTTFLDEGQTEIITFDITELSNTTMVLEYSSQEFGERIISRFQKLN